MYSLLLIPCIITIAVSLILLILGQYYRLQERVPDYQRGYPERVPESMPVSRPVQQAPIVQTEIKTPPPFDFPPRYPSDYEQEAPRILGPITEIETTTPAPQPWIEIAEPLAPKLEENGNSKDTVSSDSSIPFTSGDQPQQSKESIVPEQSPEPVHTKESIEMHVVYLPFPQALDPPKEEPVIQQELAPAPVIDSKLHTLSTPSEQVCTYLTEEETPKQPDLPSVPEPQPVQAEDYHLSVMKLKNEGLTIRAIATKLDKPKTNVQRQLDAHKAGTCDCPKEAN